MSDTTRFIPPLAGSEASPPLAERAWRSRGLWRLTAVSAGGASLAFIQSACLVLIVVKSASLPLGFLGLGTALGAGWLHRAPVLAPMLTAATVAALFNLYVLWNGWRLRRAPAAQWRIQPLSRGERRRIVLVLAASLLTLAVVAGEIVSHVILHPE